MSTTEAKPRNYFATTHWSVVLSAGHSETTRGRNALAALCETYWYPLYAYLRRGGHSPHDAEDLTQGFFASILERGALAQGDRLKGKFRSFLLAALKNHVRDHYDHGQAAKRGGGQRIISFDELSPEDRYRQEPADPISA